MSDGDNQNSDRLNQDLEHSASNLGASKNAFFDEEQGAKDTQTANEYDRSLANIHKGSGREYEESNTAPPPAGDDSNVRDEQSNDAVLNGEPGLEPLNIDLNSIGSTSDVDTMPENTEEASLRPSESEAGSLTGLQSESLLGDSLPHETEADFQVSLSSVETSGDATFGTVQPENINLAAHSVALDDNTIAENSAIGTVVGTVSAKDPEGGALTYSLSDDAGGRFTIDPNTGEIKVADALDFEDVSAYTVVVDVSDGVNVTQETFTLNVSDINEAAHSVALDDSTVLENSAIGTVVGTVSAEDPEGGALTYSLSDDAGGRFTIDPNTGEIKVADALDFEDVSAYTVVVDVSDGVNVTQETFTLNVGDLNEAAHSVALDDNAIAENSAIGTVVGTVSAEDPEGGALTYSLSDDAGGRFTIDPNTGEIKVADALDFEDVSAYNVVVDVNDGTQITQKTFTIDLGDVNEAMHSIVMDDQSVDENSAIGTVVGTISAEDPEGGTLTYSLSDDAGGKFTIDPNTGEVKVAGPLDYEDVNSYDITVDVTDGVHVASESYTVNVEDLASPTMSGLGNTISHENASEVMELDHMDMFPNLQSGRELEANIGSEVFEDMISDAEGLVINHQSDATVTFQGEGAGYRSAIGAYQINTDGTITDVQLLWGDASSNKLTAGESQATYEGIEAGSQLGFFVIANGFSDLPDDAVSGDGNTISETGTWMYVSPDFDPASQSPEDHKYNVNSDTGSPQLIYIEQDGTIHTTDGNVYHSLNQYEFNADREDGGGQHFIAGVDQENGVLNFGFEDLWGGGDADFDDGMFSVEIDSRDLVDVPNPLFAEDDLGQSTFQLSDADSEELASATIILGDIQSGDVLGLGGTYNLDGNSILLPDGSDSGISMTIVDDGSSITVSLTGTADVELYEDVIQKLNFSNGTTDSAIAGTRSISVTATDSSGEVSDTFNSSVTIEVEQGTEASDTIYGGTDDEVIHGEGGNDVLHSGAGDDIVYGDAGSDIFYFASDQGNDTFHGGDGGGWSDTIVLSDGLPSGNISDWLSLDSGSVQSSADGEVFLSEDAAGTINIGGVELTFDGVEKIEG
ncbi:cadherin domain-containing protein [Sneathiella aquimaris]|uniref:cadherin domain-containing protein n=1 Tax=Sneathiella aquimaris TaxID=2599305 RepID=UPI00146DFC05|nr:cadherin domain-containing protein [Sneathiella aquimaris]